MMRRVRSLGVAVGDQDLLPTVSRSASVSPRTPGKKGGGFAGKAAVAAVVVFGLYALLTLSRMGASKAAKAGNNLHPAWHGYEDHPGWAHEQESASGADDVAHHGGGWDQAHGGWGAHHAAGGGAAGGGRADRGAHDSTWDHLHGYHDAHWQQQQHKQQQHEQQHGHEQHGHEQHHHRHAHDEGAAHDAAHGPAGHDAAGDELKPHHHADLARAAEHGVVVEGDDEEGHYHAYYDAGHEGQEEGHYHLEYHNYPGHHAADLAEHDAHAHGEAHGAHGHAHEAAHSHDAHGHGHGQGQQQHHEQQHGQQHHEQQHQQQQHGEEPQHAQHEWRDWLHGRAAHHGEHEGGTHHGTQAVIDQLPWHEEAAALPDPTEDATHHVNHDHAPRYLHHPDHVRPQGFYTLAATDIDGRRRHLSDYAGKVTLVVNVASHCSLTDANYRGLKSVYDKYRDHGLEILAFPTDEFGRQEPGSNAEIKAFVTQHYNVTWPMFEKTYVNGPDAHPVYRYMKRELPAADGGGDGRDPGGDIPWNFIKVLIDQRGRPIRTISQAWDQAEVENAVYDLLLAGETEYHQFLAEQDAAAHRSGAWSRGAESHHQAHEHGQHAQHGQHAEQEEGGRRYDDVDTQQAWEHLHQEATSHHHDQPHHGQQQHHYQHEQQQQQQQQHEQQHHGHHHGAAADAHAAASGGHHGGGQHAQHAQHGGGGDVFNGIADDWAAADRRVLEHGHTMGDLGMKLGLGGAPHHAQPHHAREEEWHAGAGQQQQHNEQQQHQQHHHHHQQHQHGGANVW